jgi:hypothetical protein
MKSDADIRRDVDRCLAGGADMRVQQSAIYTAAKCICKPRLIGGRS